MHLTVADVCARLRCDRQKVYRLIHSGHLKAHKSPGRNGAFLFSEEDLQAYLAARVVVAAATP